jgi:hypothetical protein
MIYQLLSSNTARKEIKTYGRVYHIDKINIFPGMIGASNKPNRNRQAMSCEKVLTKPDPIRIIPQRTMATDMVLAMGSFCKIDPDGMDQKR